MQAAELIKRQFTHAVQRAPERSKTILLNLPPVNQSLLPSSFPWLVKLGAVRQLVDRVHQQTELIPGRFSL
jgi:hypothetical protein